MYNYQFIPTYMFYDISLCLVNPISVQYNSEKPVNVDKEVQEDMFTSKYLYETELLYAFNIEKFDDTAINSVINELYTIFCNMRDTNNKEDTKNIVVSLLNYAKQLAKQLLNSDDEISGFMILFSYDLFHITHLCISHIFNEDSIFDPNTNMDALNNCINTFYLQ